MGITKCLSLRVGRACGALCALAAWVASCSAEPARTSMLSNLADCGADAPTVDGCLGCTPGHRVCGADGVPRECDARGAHYTAREPCGAGLACAYGQCADLCAQARESNSYAGCEYWAVATTNSELGANSRAPDRNLSEAGAVGVDGFQFALVASNRFDVAATLRVTGGALTSELVVQVPPRRLVTVPLPWVVATANVPATGARTLPRVRSVAASGGAYRITSTIPLVVYQFNPLTFRDRHRASCAADDRTCYSYTNDASLLLPSHVLTGRYMVVAWPGQAQAIGAESVFAPGFVAVVGTSEEPTRVTVRLSAYTRAGDGVPAGTPRGTITHTLGAGDVLQLVNDAPNVNNPEVCRRERLFASASRLNEVCAPHPSFDLTGTTVEADRPVAVFAGHDCARVPFNRAACNHLEEQLFPSESLGSHYVIAATAPQLRPREPNVVRITSTSADNALTFTPPYAPDGRPVVLRRGESIDLLLDDAVEVRGTGPFSVASYLVGQNYFSNDEPLPAGTAADPSMVLEVPVEQWRYDYDFLTPDTYTRSYVNVVAPRGVALRLDGVALTSSTPGVTTSAAGDAHVVYRVDLSARPGPHHVESEGRRRFSVKVYGFGSYTSYTYPGGLDLTRISPPV